MEPVICAQCKGQLILEKENLFDEVWRCNTCHLIWTPKVFYATDSLCAMCETNAVGPADLYCDECKAQWPEQISAL